MDEVSYNHTVSGYYLHLMIFLQYDFEVNYPECDFDHIEYKYIYTHPFCRHQWGSPSLVRDIRRIPLGVHIYRLELRLLF